MAYLIFYFSLILQSTSINQPEEYKVQNYTVENGLPVNAVNRILQDDNGYLWFSTLDGLIRFDGYDFRVFNSGNTKGIVSNRIAGMIKTNFNELWMIHAEGMIMRKTGLTFKTFSETMGDFPGVAVRIIEAKDGQIWISTRRGIAVFNRDAEQFITLDEPLLNSDTWAIESTFGGGIIAVNDNGLVLWDDGITSLILEYDNFPIPPKDIMQIIQFETDEVWVMGNQGFFKVSLTASSIEYLYRSEQDSFIVWNLHKESDGTLIINSSEGFFSFDVETEQIVQLEPVFQSIGERINLVYNGLDGESIRLTNNKVFIDGREVLETNDIQSGLIDHEGSLWVSTNRNGVFQIRRSDVSNVTSNQIPGFDNIYPVIQSQDESIWAGSFVNGIYRIDGEQIRNWNQGNSSLPLNIIRFLYEDIDGILYASIWARGLWLYDNDIDDWIREEAFNALFDDELTIEAMHRDKRGRLLAGTNLGMGILENNNWQRKYNPALSGVRVIRESDDGTLYFGTNGNGLSIKKNDEILHYTNSNSDLTSSFIRDIFLQSPDTLWLATQNLGLNRVILNEDYSISVSSITERDGLIINSLHRIIKTPDGYVWISSNGGIMRISLKELNHYVDRKISDLSIVTFNERNGMVNREANGGVQPAGLLTKDHKLWFPNQKGMTIIDPLKISEGNFLPIPQPVIEEVLYSDTSLFIGKQTEIRIPRGERNLRITFSAPSFSSSDRIRFRYKLEGINPNWESGTRSREAVITNIPPGTYGFQLMVNRTGSTDYTKASIMITIPHYFYETAWFFGLIGLMGVFLVLGGIKYRTRVLEERERNLQKRVDAQTKALKEAAEQKTRFFTGITHELKTPLSLISGPLEDLLEKPEGISTSAISKLQMMNRNNYRLQNLVDQILDVTKLNADAIRLTIRPVNLTELTRQIMGQFHSKLQQEGIELVFESDTINEFIYVDTNAWERIVINLLSNAIRFSPSGSIIIVKIINYDHEISLIVKDEGVGIDPKEAEKVFEYLYQIDGDKASGGTGIGLYLVMGLVKHMGGSIRLKSKKGDGAEFIVFLKKGFNHFRETDTVIHENAPLQELKPKVRIEKSSLPIQQNPNAGVEKILVVEDNLDFQGYLHSILSEDYDVSVASNGLEALDILKQNNFDLVISDVMMPGMNGLEFVSNLREKEAFKHLPVIFLSAKNHDLDVETGLSTGADIYLTKPIQSKLLLSQIAAVLRREKILKLGNINEANSTENEFVKQIREIVYRQLANPALNITVLADALFMSRTKLYKEWNKAEETSLNEFIKQTRLNEAKVLLTDKGFTVQEAAKAVGYPNVNYFSTSFKKEFGVNPSEVT